MFGKKLEDRHKKLIALVMESKWRFALVTVCMLMVACTTVATAKFVEPILDDIFQNKDITKLYLLPFLILAIYVVRGIGMYGQEFYLSYIGQVIIRHFRDQLYDRIMDLPIRFFHEERTGVLMSRITNDVNIVRGMVSRVVTSSVRDFFTVVFLVIFIFTQIWSLALIAFLILPAAFYPIVFFGRKVRRSSTSCQEAMADMNAFLHETFSGNKVVKAFGMESFEKGRFHEKTGHLFRLEIRQAIAKSLSSPVMEVLAGVGVAAIIFYGGSCVVKGVYTTGKFMSFLAAVLMLYDPVKKMSKLNNALQEGMAAIDRIYDVMEQESEVDANPHAPDLESGSHHITFEDVSFSYDAENGDVLKGVNLSVAPGQVLALVGMSGGGKSSLVNLIPRFYDVTKGAIRIDGVDIRDTNLAFLRSRIGIVTQEPILFNETIRDNIAYGRPGASEDEIVAAAKAAYAHDFITGFPSGYDTTIGELGSRLSGGERQRICIARALIKDAPILILDEATSALDTEAERVVQKALDNLMEGRSTFVIAHRLSTIVHADHILVLSGGKVVEEGRHETLLAAQGVYARLHRMQYKGNDLEDSA